MSENFNDSIEFEDSVDMAFSLRENRDTASRTMANAPADSDLAAAEALAAMSQASQVSTLGPLSDGMVITDQRADQTQQRTDQRTDLRNQQTDFGVLRDQQNQLFNNLKVHLEHVHKREVDDIHAAFQMEIQSNHKVLNAQVKSSLAKIKEETEAVLLSGRQTDNDKLQTLIDNLHEDVTRRSKAQHKETLANIQKIGETLDSSVETLNRHLTSAIQQLTEVVKGMGQTLVDSQNKMTGAVQKSLSDCMDTIRTQHHRDMDDLTYQMQTKFKENRTFIGETFHQLSDNYAKAVSGHVRPFQTTGLAEYDSSHGLAEEHQGDYAQFRELPRKLHSSNSKLEKSKKKKEHLPGKLFTN